MTTTPARPGQRAAATRPKRTALAGVECTPKMLARFWKKVDTSAGPDGCWLWTAQTNNRGYGVFFPTRCKRQFAHRFAYELHHGPPPPGTVIDHVKDRGCTNRHCVNPAHLEAVTQLVNLLRGDTLIARNAKKTHCLHGHPFNAENTKVWRGERICRTCMRRRDAASTERKRAKRMAA